MSATNEDQDMQAQIAMIEAQLNAVQQSLQQDVGQGKYQPPPNSGFSFNQVSGGAPVGFPAPGQVQPTNAHSFAKDADGRSVFVGNLPKGDNGVTTTPEELHQHFVDCGPILTVTVLQDRATNQLKGTAYIEFATYESAGRAIDTKNHSIFKGCEIFVCWPSSRNTFPFPVPTIPLLYTSLSSVSLRATSEHRSHTLLVSRAV